MFDSVHRLGWTPLAVVENDSWSFRKGGEWRVAQAHERAARKARIVVDGVFFQLSNSGIARVWICLLKEWVRSGFADQIVVLDREGTAPR